MIINKEIVMNLVFNYFSAKLYLSTSLLLLFSSMLSANTLPMYKCATINLTATNESKQPVIFELLSNNNSLIDHDVYIDEHKYSAFLLPGKHSLKIRQWLLKDYQRYVQTNEQGLQQLLIAKTSTHEMLLKIEADYNYQLLLFNNSAEQNLILEKTTQQCDLQKHKAMLAKYEPLASKLVNSIKLPNELESRLYNVMDKIVQQSPPLTNNSTISNVMPLKLMGSFGVTFEQESASSNTELKILTVYPFSVASQLKLASGDVIMKLNNKVDLKSTGSANSKFQHYINSLKIGEQINVLVMRDGKKVLLTGKYLPTILPESQYQIVPDNYIYKAVNDSCSVMAHNINGIRSYKVIAHNGRLLTQIYGQVSPSTIKLFPGIHRLKVAFIPSSLTPYTRRKRSGRGGLMGSSGSSDDIAPRVRGGNKVGDGGIKQLMMNKTGSVRGWFKRPSTSSSSSINSYSGSTHYSASNIFNQVLTITLNVKNNHRYELNIEEVKSDQGSSSFQAIHANDFEMESDCQSEDSNPVLTPVLTEKALVQSHLLAKELQFELDQLLLELKTYYRTNGITKGVVDVYREKRLVDSYGVHGKMVSFEEGYALLVRHIAYNSLASKAGLQVDDEILAFNGHAFSHKSPTEFLAGIAKLSDGQEYQLLIQRGGENLTISSKFNINILPAFHFSVDMGSVAQAQMAITRLIGE